MGNPAPLPQRGTAPQFSAHICCGHMTGWIKMPGRPQPKRHCVRSRPSCPSPKRGQSPPMFGPCLLWPNSWIDQDATWYGGRPRPGHIVLDGDPFPPSKKGAPIFGPCLLWPNGLMDQGTTCYVDRPRPRPHCVRWGPAPPKKGAQPPIFADVYCGQTVTHLSCCWALVNHLIVGSL